MKSTRENILSIFTLLFEAELKEREIHRLPGKRDQMDNIELSAIQRAVDAAVEALFAHVSWTEITPAQRQRMLAQHQSMKAQHARTRADLVSKDGGIAFSFDAQEIRKLAMQAVQEILAEGGTVKVFFSEEDLDLDDARRESFNGK